MIAPMIASTTPSDRGVIATMSPGAGLPPGDDAFAALFQSATPPTGEEPSSHSGGDRDAAFDAEPSAEGDGGLVIAPIACPLAFPALPLPIEPPVRTMTEASDVDHAPEPIEPFVRLSLAEGPVVTAAPVAMPGDVPASTFPSDVSPTGPLFERPTVGTPAPMAGGTAATPAADVAALATPSPSTTKPVEVTAESDATRLAVEGIKTDVLAAQVAQRARPAVPPDPPASLGNSTHPSDAASVQPTPAAFDVLPVSGDRKRLLPDREPVGKGMPAPFDALRPTLFDTPPVGADRTLATPTLAATLAPPQPPASLPSGTMPAHPNGEAAWAHRASLLAGALSRGDGAALHLATAAFGTVRVDLTPVGADNRVGWTLSGSGDDAVERLHSFVPAAAEAIQRHFATSVDLRVERHEAGPSTGNGAMAQRDPSDTGQQSAGRREPAAQENALRTVNRNDPGRPPPLNARAAPHERLA